MDLSSLTNLPAQAAANAESTDSMSLLRTEEVISKVVASSMRMASDIPATDKTGEMEVETLKNLR